MSLENESGKQKSYILVDALITYYSRRAPEYDQMWRRDDPLRQREQSAIAAALKECFRKRRVLEVACGTGFWTSFMAEVADHICAIDASPEMLAIARGKSLPAQRVEFCLGDAYRLEKVFGDFNAGLANFWFSHIPKARISEFLAGFHRRVGAGAVVFMADNTYIAGVGGELVSRPGATDTFKLRELADGSKHQVLKNYYDAGQLHDLFGPMASSLEVQVGKCFWWVRYQVCD